MGLQDEIAGTGRAAILNGPTTSTSQQQRRARLKIADLAGQRSASHNDTRTVLQALGLWPGQPDSQ